jgi:hypothetical protein
MGFGISVVRGARRVPFPPAKTIAFIKKISFSYGYYAQKKENYEFFI